MHMSVTCWCGFTKDKYTVLRKNTYLQILSYLQDWCVDLNKNRSEYTQGTVDSDSVEITYSF